MNLSLDVKPELQNRVKEEALRLNIDPAMLLSEAIETGLASLASDRVDQGNTPAAPWTEQTARNKAQGERSQKNARLIARLRSFAEGDAEQQRRDLAALQAGLEEARPGQRRLFDEGVNP